MIRRNPPTIDVQTTDRCLRDIVALSTLPAIWSGAEPRRIAESLAAALYTTLSPDFVYVSFTPSSGCPEVAVAQVDRYETSPELAERLGVAILSWARSHDPDELLEDEFASGTRHISTRPIGHYAELGVIAAAFSCEPTSFQHLLMDVAASQAATAIQNARLLGSLRESEERLSAELAASQTLQDVSTQLIQGGDDQSLYERIVDAAVVIMCSELASLQMLYPERGAPGSGGELKLLASRGFSAEAAKFFEWVRVDSKCICGMAMSAGQRAIVPDVGKCEAWAGTKELAAYREGGILACQSTPLMSRSGKLLGMISTHWKQPHQPGEQELRLLDVLARQAADLIERNQSQEALRHHGKQFETLVNRAPLGVYLVDADFRIREVNPIAEPMFGDIEGGVVGRVFDEIIHSLWEKEYADEVVRIFRHTLNTGVPYVTPERAVFRADLGVTEYYEWRLDRIAMPDGRYGLVCYFRDISDQVQARQTIADSENRLRFVLDSAPQKIFTATPSGDIDYFNPIWTEFTGLSFEQIRDWGWTQFIHPDDVAENVRAWQHAIDAGEPFDFEHRFRRADGEYPGRLHVNSRSAEDL